MSTDTINSDDDAWRERSRRHDGERRGTQARYQAWLDGLAVGSPVIVYSSNHKERAKREIARLTATLAYVRNPRNQYETAFFRKNGRQRAGDQYHSLRLEGPTPEVLAEIDLQETRTRIRDLMNKTRFTRSTRLGASRFWRYSQKVGWRPQIVGRRETVGPSDRAREPMTETTEGRIEVAITSPAAPVVAHEQWLACLAEGSPVVIRTGRSVPRLGTVSRTSPTQVWVVTKPGSHAIVYRRRDGTRRTHDGETCRIVEPRDNIIAEIALNVLRNEVRHAMDAARTERFSQSQCIRMLSAISEFEAMATITRAGGQVP